MKLFAISDLHLSNPVNLDAFLKMKKQPEDWLILAGDLAERIEIIDLAFAHASQCFSRVIWVPGNHELWVTSEYKSTKLCGVSKYEHLVDIARSYGVLTPEDPYLVWPPSECGKLLTKPIIIAPLFLLYDYSFGPSNLTHSQMIAWAQEKKCVAADEYFLLPDPYESIKHWCHERLVISQRRLVEIDPHARTVLINHFPLRKDLIYIPRVPRFLPWCGTVETENWHIKFNADVVVTGHLHVRRTDWRDETRFEEVSLGYPSQWDQSLGISPYLKQILP